LIISGRPIAVLSIALSPSRAKGAPTALVTRVDGREFYLHSRFDPHEEAQLIASGVIAQERTLYVVLGFGLGYHVKAILDRVPASSHVLVVEPDSACLNARALADRDHPAAAWIGDTRLHFLVHQDPKLTPIHLADRMATLRLLAIKMVRHIPSALTAEDFYGALANEIPRSLPANVQRRLRTIEQSLDGELRNFWANLPCSWNSAPIGRLRGLWRGKPLIIVSSGPSLSAALPQLASYQSRAMIVATASAVRLLMAAGIRPDLVISVDPYAPNAAHFDGWDTAGVPLVYYHRIFRGIPAAYRGPMAAFAMHDEPRLPLCAELAPSPFQRGGTVAFSALQLAHFVGADPVIFVGQDFAFPGGRTHAAGALYGEAHEAAESGEDFIPVPSADGQFVITSRLHHAYLLHMQDYLRQRARQHDRTRHINTSGTGAQIRGMEHLSLADAFAGRPSLDVSPSTVFQSAMTKSAGISRARQDQTLANWSSELDPLARASRDMTTTGAILDAFARTSLYAAAAPSYDSLRYLAETRRLTGGADGELVRHLRAHLNAVSGDLRAGRRHE
jgi:hypothetical protein